MTAPDPRSRPSKGHETPLDGTATTRTDATVRPHDADALDAWLESVVTNGTRSIGNGNGSSPHLRTANGSGPSARDTPLVATARRFHARIGDAEARHATDIPEVTLEAIIWERIMSSQLTSNQAAIVRASPRPNSPAQAPARPEKMKESRPFPITDRFAGGHPAFSAVLAAAVILAIVAIFRVIGAPPSGPTDDPNSTTGPNSNPALVAGSPLASPAAFDCAGPVSVSSGSTSRISDYVPLDPVTDPTLVDKANATLTIALECTDPDLPNQPNSIPSIAMTDATRDRIEAVRSMWPVDPWGYAASFDPESTALIDIDHRTKSAKIEPSELFEMPNGRFGAIAYQVSELPELQPNGEPFLGVIAFFLSFRPGEGPSETSLVLTEYFPLCVDEDDGTTFCDSATIPIPGHDNGSTPAATPLASSAASPVASPSAGDERWLVDAETATCTVDAANPPGAVAEGWVGFAPNAGLLPLSDTSPDNQTAAAEVYLQVQQCGGFDGPAVETLMSDRFAEKLTVLDSDTPPGLTAEETALGRQISGAYVGEDPMTYVIEGAPLPREASSPGYGSASRRVLLPDDIVQLADGRIGGPAHVFFRINDPGGGASYLQPRGFLETGFVIFAAEDGRWVIDDYLLICIGDCDAYWASREVEGTPAGSPESADLASLGASGSLIVRDETQGEAQAQLRRVPLDGGMPEPLSVSGYSSAIRTSQPDVVVLDDAQGNQVAYNVTTGIASRAFSTRNIASLTNVGPHRVIGYSDPVDFLVVDLRTMRLTSLADLAGGSVDISDPAFTVQGDESGNLIVGITSAGDPGSTSSVAVFIDRDGEHVRILGGWTASGQVGISGAIAPDGASIAYPAYSDGSVVVRTETIAGEPIGDIPWPEDTPVAHMVLPDAQTLLIMSEGEVLRADLASGTRPAPIATYPDEIWNTILSPDGSHLLFATLDPLAESNGSMAWHWLDIGTGEVRPIPEATGGHPFWTGPSYTADTVMLWVPVGLLENGTYRVLFVDVTTGAVTVAQPTGVTSGLAPGETISEDGAVFAAYGIGSPDAPRFRILESWGSIPLSGQLVVFDRASRSVVQIPFPDSGLPQEIIEPALTVSPDGRHVVLSVRWTDDSGEQAQSWITTTDGQGAWTPVEGGLVVGWVGE